MPVFEPPARDVILLNSDTLVPGLDRRLSAAAYSAADIGTATPLSNDATVFSYPREDGPTRFPTKRRRSGSIAWRAAPAAALWSKC